MPLDIFPTRDADAYVTSRPGFGPGLDPSFGEGFEAAWKAVGGSWRDMRVKRNRFETVQSWISDFQKSAGYEIDNPELRAVFGNRAPSAAGYEALRKAWEAEKQKRPDFDLPEPPTMQSAQDAAIAAERKLQGDVAAVQARPGGFARGAGVVAGDIAGTAIDPINLIAAGASLGAGGILATAIRGGAISGVSQAAITARGYGLSQEVNPDYGLGEAAGEVASAVVGGAALTGGFKALAVAWGRIRARTQVAPETAPATTPESPEAVPEPVAAPEAPPEVQPPLFDETTIPRHVRDAGNVVERQATVDTTNPYRGAGPEGEIAHASASKEAEAAIIEGRAPALPDDDLTAGKWRPGKVYAADGTEVGVRYEVVEADTLVASQRDDLSPNPDYPPELQPRDRTRAASAEQIAAIASKLEPERLGPSADAANGAPIVGPDNVVESGNGRVLALRRAYGIGTSDAYRTFLKGLGFETDGMNAPVLIARRVTTLDENGRIAFAGAANRVTTLRMSAPEQALADARLVDGAVLEKLTDGGMASEGNRAFARAFFSKLPQSERGGLIDRQGNMSAEGIRRVEAALLARAYGDPALLSRILESPDSGVKALGGALTDTAAKWATMRDAVARGDIPAGMDITDDLLNAFRLVAKSRDTRQKLAMLVDQAEMFETPSPVTRALLGLMFRNADLTQAASRQSVARGLAGFADEAIKNTTDARLFGDPLGSGEILSTALAKVGRDDLGAAAEQATLPLLAREKMVDPVTDDAVLHELEHLQETTPDLAVPVVDADGNVTMRPVKGMIDEADAEIKAAEEIEACASGQMMPDAAE